MTKIVINTIHGDYGLSAAAMAELGVSGEEAFNEDRANPALVACVEKLGKYANGRYAELNVVEIPDDVEWEICEYDGAEWVAEKHRIWEWPAHQANSSTDKAMASIQEAQQAKIALQEKIADALHQFSVETGLLVTYVNLDHATILGQAPKYVVQVEAKF